MLKRLTNYWRKVQVAAALESLQDLRDGADESEDDPRNEESVIWGSFTYKQFRAGTCPTTVYQRAFRRIDAAQQRQYERELAKNPNARHPELAQHIPIVFSPFSIKIPGERKLLYVMFGNAVVDRRGIMATADVESDLPPVWIGRASLAPTDGLEDGLFPLADADKYYDEISAKLSDLNTWPAEWPRVLEVCDRIWMAAANRNSAELLETFGERYDLQPGWIRVQERDPKKLTIIRMYERLAEKALNGTLPSLYQEAALAQHRQVFKIQRTALHLGQMRASFPLEPSQRTSLLAYLQTPSGHVTAVNGPPGTGKTTLLQSVVASEMVARALAKSEAPLYIAGAATNQAVANIIKAFREATDDLSHPLADRWIPGLGRRYGVYFRAMQGESINLSRGSLVCIPMNLASHKEYDAEGIARVRRDIDTRNKAGEEIPIDWFFVICESDEIRREFLHAASTALGKTFSSVENCIADIRVRLEELKSRIARYSRSVDEVTLSAIVAGVGADKTYSDARRTIQARIALSRKAYDDLESRLREECTAELVRDEDERRREDALIAALETEQRETEANAAVGEQDLIDGLQVRIRAIKEAKASYGYFRPPTTFIAWVKEAVLPWRRNAVVAGLAEVASSLEELGFGTFQCGGIKAMRDRIEATLEMARELSDQVRKIQSGQSARMESYRVEKETLEGFIRNARSDRTRTHSRNETRRAAALRSAGKAVSKESEAFQALEIAFEKFTATSLEITGKEPSEAFAEMAGRIDTTLRVEAFLLATHYWEGRFITEVKNSGWRAQLNRERAFRTMAMIAPCFVSTFDKMGTAFNVMRQDIVHPMWELADTLIIDEAGQASPDKGAFAFSLAKKALVVGDNLQLPPVNSTDGGTILTSIARSSSVLGEEFVTERGLLTGKIGRQRAPGSLMRMASAAAYFDMSPTTRGMWLREHFRCDPRIIQFCNRIWYTGETSLVPRRPKPSAFFLPHFGHVHIVGTFNNKSNEAEVRAIIEWINIHGLNLQTHYKLPLHEIVAVLTPFSNQRRLLRAYRDKKFVWRQEYAETKEIVMGTVHALQGAERPVVLFSTAYDQPKSSYFFDTEHTMLNVAVSRAKDAFIVFGDRRLFQQEMLDSNRPSTYLREHLFDESLFEVPPLPKRA